VRETYKRERERDKYKREREKMESMKNKYVKQFK
jgi:hypothetical protein